MVVASKSNGQVHKCVDLTQLNENAKRKHFFLLWLEEALASLKENKYFSKMDANCRFWQIKSEDSREYSTFTTFFGRSMFSKMPFGVLAAAEFFKRHIMKILTGQETET